MTEHRHETTDMNPKYVLYFGAGLAIVGLLIQLGIWWMFRQFERLQARHENQPVLVNIPAVIPEPHLQINPQGDLQQLRREEDELLSTYGWVDRDKGTARIPIDRAMQLFLEKQKK